jgi:DNA-binding protein HU-beta
MAAKKSLGKSDLVEAIAKEAGLSKADAARALDAAIGAIKTALKRGGKVTLVGFGTFEVRRRKRRKGVNPRTGEPLTIPATKVPAFRAGRALKNLVAGKK